MLYGIPLYPSAITEPYLFNNVAEVLIDSSLDNWFVAKTLNCEIIVNNECGLDIIKAILIVKIIWIITDLDKI